MAALHDVEHVRSHWWPRPGWRPGRLMYTWHLTFEHATALHRLARAYQDRLVVLDGLNLVPLRWLHLTVQGVGYVDETPDHLVDSIAKATTARLRNVEPFDLSFDRAVVLEESIVLAPSPAGLISRARDAIRSGIADVVGHDHVHTGPEQAHGFRPHVSLAYINEDGPALPYVRALATVQAEPAAARISEAALIVQDRVLDPEWVYRWTTRAIAPFGELAAP